ncbi:hypothetical protein R3P38DRAFT_3258292 [Favolaschia claudopus]|uniref:Uncharacterized protein n=1 Tax=Favolaschia claudopus TaxID=2862362 RepID=A0AAW0D6L4_9AGAR
MSEITGIQFRLSKMPSMPSSPLSAPTFLPSPLVGLGCSLALLVVVTSAYAIYLKIGHILAARSAHRSDIERPADPSTTECNSEPKNSSSADVLAAAKAALVQQKRKFDKRKQLVATHKALMAQPSAPRKQSMHLSTHIRRFLAKNGSAYTPGRSATARPTRALSGPSPLRAVFTAPQIVDTPAVLAPIPEPASSPMAVIIPVIAIPAPVLHPAVTRTRTVALLEAIARDEDTDSGSEYSDSENDDDDGTEVSVSLDAKRNVCCAPMPIPDGEDPKRISCPDIACPKPLVDSRLRNIRAKRKAVSEKRISKRQDKENGGVIA